MRTPEAPRPADRKFWTPGVWFLLILLATGAAVILLRFIVGLAGVTHLDQQHPWGLWIAFDLATGVALAAGGFTTAALVHIFHRQDFHVVSRPALLTAMLGYTFAVLGLLADLGRPYNIWHPILPWMQNPNSVLFEVGMCVMIYLTVLYVEFAPIGLERLSTVKRFPRLARACDLANRMIGKTMFLFIIAGVVLSFAHQSSLGSLLLIAPSKVHPLWWTPVLPILFLLSAISVGFPMVIFESLLASRSLRLPLEMPVLTRLARYIPPLLSIYLAVKVTDMLIRESYVYLGQLTVQSVAFTLEMVIGVIIPLALLMSPRSRRSRLTLLAASGMVVLGVAVNRINVFLVAFQPFSAQRPYFPSTGEIAVSAGLVAGLVLCYRLAVVYLPVISQPAIERISDERDEVVEDLEDRRPRLGGRGVGRSHLETAGTQSSR